MTRRTVLLSLGAGAIIAVTVASITRDRAIDVVAAAFIVASIGTILAR